MENEEIRLQALRVLNEHFKYEGKFGCLEDRQVKLVLDAMIEFRQFGVSGQSEHLVNFLLHLNDKELINNHDFDYEKEAKKYLKKIN